MKMGWEQTTLGELGRVFNGNSINENEKKAHFEGLREGVPYIGTKDVSFDHEIEYESGVKIPEGKQDGFKLAPSNTVFVCAEGGSAGRKVAHSDRPVYFVNKLFAICPKPLTSSRFVFYYCISEAFKQDFKGAMAGVIGGVSLNKFRALRISLPPPPEQKRIVGILDKAFDGIATVKANAKKNVQNARAIYESYLQSVFFQRGKGWDIKTIDDLSELVTKGTTPTSIGFEFVSTGINFVKVESVSTRGQFISDKLAHITPSCHAALRRSQLRDGDILFSIAGALGRTALVNEAILPANTNQALAIIRLKQDYAASRKFVMSVLETSAILKQIDKCRGGAAQQNLSLTQIRDFQIPFPPLEEQKNIVSKLDTLRTKASRLESIHQQKLAAMEAFKKSLLHQAISGQLRG